jgi:undecaprenyl diphosphate synthase
MQSALFVTPPPAHVALVMDGNGRWARSRGLPRVAGHRAGAAVVPRIVEAAAAAGIGTLTLYAFSADNWRRPPAEVEALMALFRRYLLREAARCVRTGTRLTVLGRRDRLPPTLLAAIADAEAATAGGRRLHLRIALDYSSREAILRAARLLAEERADEATPERFESLLGRVHHADSAPPVDLLVRTGGERRLSDFLLWECAYAELWFTDRRWPDFTATDLARAVADFRSRERRWGGLGAADPVEEWRHSC